MSRVDEGYARACWERRNHTKFRHFLSNTKREAMELYGVDEPQELRGHPPLGWVPSEEMWARMVEHWSSTEFQKKSACGLAARMSMRGEHRRISKSGCGRIDVVDRQLRAVKI